MAIGIGLIGFLREERGQDFVEYSFLLGAIALAGAATIVLMGGVLDRIWILVNGRLANASN